MTTEHAGETKRNSDPPPARGIRALGVISFTALGFLLGGLVGGAVEGDLVGGLHVGVPAALVALVFAGALVSRPGGGSQQRS
jgi:hypothetical protein